jgi:hypothetical protein
VPTFIEIEESWMFGLLVLLVSSQAYHLCCLLFMMDDEALLPIGSMNFVVVGN